MDFRLSWPEIGYAFCLIGLKKGIGRELTVSRENVWLEIGVFESEIGSGF